jgi:hypothetical protein
LFFAISAATIPSASMTLKALATIPTAFLTGIVAPLGYRLLGRLDANPSTMATPLIAYAVVSIAPFLVFVIGFDRRRWNVDANYWFSQEGKTDQRRTWMRWGAYFVGLIVGNAL